MRAKGNVLIIVLLMLLFSSFAVLKLNEDNYLAHLIKIHIVNLSNARKALSNTLTNFPAINEVCYVNTDNKIELELFWQSQHSLCQWNVSGTKVDYAYRVFQEDLEEGVGSSYQQVTLRTKNGNEYEWLRVVKKRDSGRLVSWTYHL